MDLNALHRNLTRALALVDAAIEEATTAAAPVKNKTASDLVPTSAPNPAEKPAPKANPAAKPPTKPAPAPKVTVEHIRSGLLKVIEGSGGNDAAREILAGFGAKKVSNLTEDQFPTVLAAIEKFLNPPAESEAQLLAAADEDDLTA
jgi:hypothetical protein